MTTTLGRLCGLCGRPVLGFGMAAGVYLCHHETRDCYHRWTVYGARPGQTVTSGNAPIGPVGREVPESDAARLRRLEDEVATLSGHLATAELKYFATRLNISKAILKLKTSPEASKLNVVSEAIILLEPV